MVLVVVVVVVSTTVLVVVVVSGDVGSGIDSGPELGVHDTAARAAITTDAVHVALLNTSIHRARSGGSNRAAEAHP